MNAFIQFIFLLFLFSKTFWTARAAWGNKLIGLSFPDSLDEESLQVRGWELQGSAKVTASETVVLTDDLTYQAGGLWSNNRATSLQLHTDWELEVKFKVISQNELAGDGFALWLVEEHPETTDSDINGAFGHAAAWKGLGVFFDSFRNDQRHEKSFPIILAKFSSHEDDPAMYIHDLDGLTPEIMEQLTNPRGVTHMNDVAVCSSNFLFHVSNEEEAACIIKLTHQGSNLLISVGTPAKNEESQFKWNRCGVLRDITFDSPKGYFLGFTGLTSEVSSKQEIMGVSFLTEYTNPGAHHEAGGDTTEAHPLQSISDEIVKADDEIVIEHGKLKEATAFGLASKNAKLDEAQALIEEQLKRDAQIQEQDREHTTLHELRIQELVQEKMEKLKAEGKEIPTEKEIKRQAEKDITRVEAMEKFVQDVKESLLFEVQIPSWGKEGDSFKVSVKLESGETVPLVLHIPHGKKAGDTLVFRVPRAEKVLEAIQPIVPEEEQEKEQDPKVVEEVDILRQVYDMVSQADGESIIAELLPFKELFDQYKQSNSALESSSTTLDAALKRVDDLMLQFEDFVVKYEGKMSEAMKRWETKIENDADVALSSELYLWQIPFVALTAVWGLSSCFFYFKFNRMEQYKRGLL